MWILVGAISAREIHERWRMHSLPAQGVADAVEDAADAS